jgi:predicted permease
MNTFFRDLRYALRTLGRSPGFTAAAVLILALGIGANTAIFSLVDAVVLHPLPGVARPEALVDLSGPTLSYPSYRSLRDATAGSLDGLASWRERSMSLSVGAVAERIRGAIVSGNYFDLLGARAASGRLLAPADEDSGEANVVLAARLWKNRFGSDPAIVGKAIRLNGAPFTVIGVAPEGFRGTAFGEAPDLWVSIGAWPQLATGQFQRLDLQRRGWGWLSALGRLKRGVSIAQAQAAVEVATRQESAAFPDDLEADAHFTLRPTLRAAAGFGQEGDPVSFLALLVGAVGVTLAIACANLANLLLARAAARRKEIAVRQAIGASRSRLLRQLLTESVTLSLLGGAAGLLVASWALGLAVRMPLPGDFSLALFAPALDLRALGFAFLLSVATGLAFGLLPALQASGLSVGAVLKASASTASPRSAARGVLVAAQVSLCLLLLVAAGLLARSLQRALATDLGFQPRGLTLASVDPGLQRYDAARSEAFFRELRERVAASPGVREASWVGLVPLSGGQWTETFSVPGRPAPEDRREEVEINLLGAGFFRTMEIGIAEGREFDDRLDLSGSAAVVVVNEAMARRVWPGESALGRRIDIAGAQRTVVGVARNFRTGSLREGPVPQVYFPLAQGAENAGLVTLVARGQSERTDVASIVRAEIRRLDPTLPVAAIGTCEAEIGGQLVPQRLGSALLGLFGLLALALAAVGIYAVISYAVAGRTREIGIRMALGARSSDVRALVVAQSARPVAAGLLAGVALGAAAARLLRGFLFGISASDPVTFFAVTALLLLCALGAAYLPARRASRIDPMTALRTD